MEAIFSADDERMKALGVVGEKENPRQEIKRFMLGNSEKVHEQLLKSKNVELQITILGIVLKTLTKEEIAANGFLGVHSKSLQRIQKNRKDSVMQFLKEFSVIEKSCIVSGAEVEEMQFSEKTHIGGYIFMGEENFRFQKDKEVVIIQFKSIEGVVFEGVELKIKATEGRSVKIKFKYLQDIGKLKEKVLDRFGQIESEESIVVDIGKKVTFAPLLNCKVEKTADEEIRSVEEKKNNDCIKEPIRENKRKKRIIKGKKEKVHKKNSSKQKAKKRTGYKRLKAIKVKKASKKVKGLANYKKEVCFENLSQQINEIFKDKMKIADLVYKALKEKAIAFKTKAEAVQRLKVFRMAR
ncbi:hypothetical protein GINT2_001433 [Glugoides intestinalis]